MVEASFWEVFWKVPLYLVGAFLLFCLVSYPFQRKWLRARVRTDEWMKGWPGEQSGGEFGGVVAQVD